MPRAGLGAGVFASGAGLAVFGVVPWLLFAGIAGLSILAYFMYSLDKSAAQRNAQRISESTWSPFSGAGQER